MTVRFDVNEYWLWKLEAHYMDGTGDGSSTTTRPTRTTWPALGLVPGQDDA